MWVPDWVQPVEPRRGPPATLLKREARPVSVLRDHLAERSPPAATAVFSSP